MVLYDFTHRAEINVQLLVFFGLLMIGGLLVFFLARDIEGDENWVTRLFNYSKEEMFTSKRTIKMMGVGLFMFGFFPLFFHIKEYVYYKKIGWFENIKSISGRIDNIESQNVKGKDFVTLNAANLTFSFIKDECYNSQRSLFKNDSVKIDYFEMQNKVFGKETEGLSITKIELKE